MRGYFGTLRSRHLIWILGLLLVAVGLSQSTSYFEFKKSSFLQVVPPEKLPRYGTFWSLQRSNSPPLPFFAPYLRAAESPVYLLDAERRVFLVDDLAFDYAALYQEFEEQRQLRKAAWELGLLSDAEYWAAEGGAPGPMGASYGAEDFWIELVGITNQLAYLTLHGTIGDGLHYYQLLSKTNLTPAGEWKLGELKLGDWGTNRTDFLPVYVGNDTNLFFRGQHRGFVTIVNGSDDAVEGNAVFPSARTGWFTVNAYQFSENVTVYYRVSGTASNGVDYTNLTGVVTVPAATGTSEIYIQPLSDALAEGTETVTVTLVQTNAYLIEPTYQSATLRIKDSPTSLRVRADFPPTAYELDGPPGAAAQNGTFQLERYDDSVAGYPPMTVHYNLSGTAGNGVDYTNLPSSLTFTQDQQVATLTVSPLSDALVEGAEAVILSLVPTNTYLIEPGFASAAITIADSSTTVGITKIDDAIEPNPASSVTKQTGRFSVTRNDLRGEIFYPLTVTYTIGGMASNGVDYTNLTGTVTFQANEISTNIFVEPLYDGQLEGDETVTPTLTQFSDGYLINPDFASATVTLRDNMSSNLFQKVVNLSGPIGIDYHQPSNSILVSRSLSGNNFSQLYTNTLTTNVVVTNWSGVSGLLEEVKLFTVKETANGFTNGEVFFSSGTGIGWISPDGAISNKTWCVLTNAFETNALPIRGGICMDETGGAFSNQLIVVTSAGNPDNSEKGVWRIRHNGTNGLPTLIAKIATSHLEGVLTLTNDIAKWGPWAGKIITGNEAEAKLFTIDSAGGVMAYDSQGLVTGGIRAEDFDLVQTNQDLYVCDQNNFGAVYKLSHTYLTNFVGDLMITDAGEYVTPAKLFFLRWDSATTNFSVRTFFCRMPNGSDGVLEHVTFAPISLPTIP